MYGTHIPFSAALLSQLYPIHASYVTPVNTVTDANFNAGFILAPEAAATKQAAFDSLVGRALGDVTGDDRVNCADLLAASARVGTRQGQMGYMLGADVDGNGVVDIRDIAAVSRLLPRGSVCR